MVWKLLFLLHLSAYTICIDLFLFDICSRASPVFRWFNHIYVLFLNIYSFLFEANKFTACSAVIFRFLYLNLIEKWYTLIQFLTRNWPFRSCHSYTISSHRSLIDITNIIKIISAHYLVRYLLYIASIHGLTTLSCFYGAHYSLLIS